MSGHVLTRSDSWFLQKGQKDILSRTTFAVGHSVVVCENHHVMLEEFYDGSCPTCHSSVTIPFCRENVEPAALRFFVGACPSCGTHVTIPFKLQGTSRLMIGTCPVCQKNLQVDKSFIQREASLASFKRLSRMVANTMKAVFFLLIASVVAFAVLGTIPSQHWQECLYYIIQPLEQLIGEVAVFLMPESTTSLILERNQLLMEHTVSCFSLVFSGTMVLSEMISQRSLIVVLRLEYTLGRMLIFASMLWERTLWLIGWIKDWVRHL